MNWNGRGSKRSTCLGFFTIALAYHATISAGARLGQCKPGLDAFGSQRNLMCPLPVHDLSEARLQSASPWALPLRCVRPIANGEASHCLYIASTFRSQGVSILTTPETAASLAGAKAVGDEAITEVLHKGFRPGPVWSAGGPAYVVEEIQGKGKGVIARRFIRQGEVLMIDFPALITEKDFMARLHPNMRKASLRRAFDGLPKETQNKVLELAQSIGGDQLLDIFQTNTCSVALGDGKAHMGLFPEVSRMNHACRPNAFYRFSPKTLTIEVAAYRDIKPGEEININYAFLGMPYKERRKYLQETWGFKCTCSLCLASPGEREASDNRRMQIVKTRDDMVKSKDEGRHAQTIKLAEELIQLYEAEGLKPLLAEAYETLATAYFSLGHLQDAETRAALAVNGWIQYRGADSEQADQARILLHRIQKWRV